MYKYLYQKALPPVAFDGNVFTKGSKRPLSENPENIKSLKELAAIERYTLDKPDLIRKPI